MGGGACMKKKIIALIAASLTVLSVSAFCACKTGEPPADEPELPVDWLDSEENKENFSAGGYVKGKTGDFTQYENTDAYRKVSTADEFVSAVVAAKCHYTNVWDDATNTYTQIPAEGYTEETMWGSVRVIEITQDLNLGYYNLSSAAKGSGVVDDYAKNLPKWDGLLSNFDTVLENGISQIKIENTSNLLVYSKTGAKITYAGFKLTSDNNVVFRNLQFDGLWQWEDAPVNSTAKIGDYDWYGWAYFKIAFCGYTWIDHCTFGKSYDGQIDCSNPVYNANAGTAFRAPLGADGNNGLQISWCNFNAGSDDKDGYIYKEMQKIEQGYLAGKTDHLYYKSLRDAGVSFEQILYGIAIPQKKGFLCGDDAKFSGSYENADDYNFNLKLRVSFANCKFINLEDRLPKLRGGNAYMYNCVVDSSQYYKYRTELKTLNAASIVSKVNGTWKCGLVSQGIVCGNGGSVMAESCIFRGIDSLLKNNDSKNTAPYVNGGYSIVNCSYQRGEGEKEYIGSSSDPSPGFPNATPAKLKTEFFKWNTADGKQPFTVRAIGVESLEEYLSHEKYGSGVRTEISDKLLKSSY